MSQVLLSKRDFNRISETVFHARQVQQRQRELTSKLEHVLTAPCEGCWAVGDTPHGMPS